MGSTSTRLPKLFSHRVHTHLHPQAPRVEFAQVGDRELITCSNICLLSKDRQTLFYA